MPSPTAVLRDQRGSALLAALALAVVMTIMGLALFDMGRIESALVLANKTDAQALEIAQAGLERALDKLRRTFLVEQATNPSLLTDLAPSWADGHTEGGSTTPICTGNCTTGTLRVIDSGYIANTTYQGGSYTLGAMLLTSAEATGAPYGQACAANVGGTCTDLLVLRSEGVLAGTPPGYTGRVVLQALVKISNGPTGLDGLVTGSQARKILGNVNIAGSIAVLNGPAGQAAWQFNGNANQLNNWSGLDVAALDRIKPRPLICPKSTACTSGELRESLNAVLLVQKPFDVRAVDLQGAGTAGTSVDSGLYGNSSNPTFDPLRRGLGPIKTVYVADGCVMPCNQTVAPIGSFTNPGNVWTSDGNLTNPYPTNAPTDFPQLTDPTTINNIRYDHYACPAGFSPCTGTEFFVTNATTLAALNYAFVSGSNCTVGCTSNAITGIRYFHPPSNMWLNDGAICWTPSAGSPAMGLLEFKRGSCASGSPLTSTLNPLMIYTQGTLKIEGNIRYSGAAIFLTAPGAANVPGASTGVVLNDSIITACVPIGGDPCARKFLIDPTPPTTVCNNTGFADRTPNCATDLLSVLTTTPNGTGGSISYEGHNGDVVMGIFYSGSPNNLSTGGKTIIEKQIKVVGQVNASQFDMKNNPDFYQVPGASVAVLSFTGTPYSIAMVPGYWRKCSPGGAGGVTTATNPATPTGACGYD